MIVRTSAKSRFTSPGHGDQVRDPLDTLSEHVVGEPERIDDRRLPLDHLQQPVVLDHDDRVDALGQLGDALLGNLAAPAAFEGERPRHDADGQSSDLAREIGDDRRGARSGAAPLARRHEHHVGALQDFFQLVARLEGRRPTDLGVGAGSEATRDVVSDVDLHVGVAHQERLCVRVDADELHASKARVDHAVDGVRPTAADADDLDHCHVVATLSLHSPPTSISTFTRA